MIKTDTLLLIIILCTLITVGRPMVEDYEYVTGGSEIDNAVVSNKDGDFSTTSMVNLLQFPVGSIMAWPTEVEPPGWILCDGRALSDSKYATLSAILNSTTAPNLKGCIPVGKSSTGTFSNLNAQIGSETVTLGNDNLPQHSHPITYGYSMPITHSDSKIKHIVPSTFTKNHKLRQHTDSLNNGIDRGADSTPPVVQIPALTSSVGLTTPVGVNIVARTLVMNYIIKY